MKKFGGRCFALSLGVAALVGLFANSVHAQDISLKPTYGQANLKVGFLPDPHKVNVVAGGNIQTNLGGVASHVANAPDYKLFYEAGQAPLTFYVESQTDTTLLINLPNGTWVANDDGGGFPNPLIKLTQPMSGRYDIYVGTFGENTGQAVLKITELK